jgi:hypothetical protein
MVTGLPVKCNTCFLPTSLMYVLRLTSNKFSQASLVCIMLCDHEILMQIQDGDTKSKRRTTKWHGLPPTWQLEMAHIYSRSRRMAHLGGQVESSALNTPARHRYGSN